MNYFYAGYKEVLPKYKAFLWTLTSRNIIAEEYDIETKEELEEPEKITPEFFNIVFD